MDYAEWLRKQARAATEYGHPLTGQRFNDIASEIARLQAEVSRLHADAVFWRNEADERSNERDIAWNDAIEKSASLFTHPEEEGIADRIRELKE